MTYEFLMGYHACGVQIPRTSSSYRMMSWGFLRFEMNTHKPFFICGYSFQNELGFQRDGKFLWLWVSNRGESALLAGESKGDRVPLAVVSKGGGAALAGRIQ